jgi:hypothetical protein
VESADVDFSADDSAANADEICGFADGEGARGKDFMV